MGENDIRRLTGPLVRLQSPHLTETASVRQGPENIKFDKGNIMSSIFQRAAAEGQAQSRTPFMDTKGIFKIKFEAVRSGENGNKLPFVALDVSIQEYNCPGGEKFVKGETRTIMNTESAIQKYKKMFSDLLVSWALGIARALHAQSGGTPDTAPAPSDVTAEVLEAFFGAQSILIGREMTVEVTPRLTENKKTVYNFSFSA
jgi:hypothetical protein